MRDLPERDRPISRQVDEVLGGRRPNFEDLARLTYTKRVLEEEMRLYPPSRIMPRIVNTDDVIGGYAVKAGSVLLLSPFVTHREPSLWEQPAIFDPDRFTPERSAVRPRYAYMPLCCA
ncbi:cytochrome P450 [Sorangium sp. So ce1014]|uniref:cytochrome P450 n=1 Tax=Sorangium sp. So ce1014 TaxID=3133326 RepID=UPI003F642DEE